MLVISVWSRARYSGILAIRSAPCVARIGTITISASTSATMKPSRMTIAATNRDPNQASSRSATGSRK